jgi:putative SOS response-associated peptidase YedK
MCGRYSFGKIDRMDFSRFGVAPVPSLVPRWNISPGTDVLAVRHAADGHHETAMLRWGLVPSWTKDPSIGHKLANARAETAHEKPSFRAAFRARRCLLPADGFFEWQVVAGRRHKQPWRIEAADGAILALGGLWEFWRDEQGEKLETCTVLTVPVNAALAHIHDRLPLILDHHDWHRWLSPHTSVDAARALLHAPPEDALAAWKVSEAVNVVSHDDPSIIEPVTP